MVERRRWLETTLEEGHQDLLIGEVVVRGWRRRRKVREDGLNWTSWTAMPFLR